MDSGKECGGRVTARLLSALVLALAAPAFADGESPAESPPPAGSIEHTVADDHVLKAERPLWELAFGGGLLRAPDYRGSDQSRTYPFPFVFPVYRGEVLRVDEDGIRGVVYDGPAVELDFSVDANVPVSSDDNRAREGMPRLDATGQIGPSLKVTAWRSAVADQDLEINLPLRGVFAVNSSGIDHVGFSASPHLTYHRAVEMAGRRWRMGLSAGLEFGDSGLHGFFYDVAPEFATPDRPAYDAGSGFGGTRLIATFTSYTPSNWLSLFARYDHVRGAVYEDSPLVRQRGALTAGFIVSWFAMRSSRTVEARAY
jgi:MipA family protein